MYWRNTCMEASQIVSLHSASLQDLSLSNNLLTGSIPGYIQERLWYNLDLSFNKLDGMLNSNLTVPRDGSLSLQVNRLSGAIPQTLQSAEDISILSGNRFSCDLQQTQLPEHDPDRANYSCGSNDVNQAAIVWLVCFLLIALSITIIVLRYRHRPSASMHKFILHCREWHGVFNNPKYLHAAEMNELYDLNELHLVIQKLRITLGGIAVVAVGVLLPTYSVLKIYYKNSSIQSFWYVSAALLSGDVPAITIFILFVFLLLLFSYIWNVYFHQYLRLSKVDKERIAAEEETSDCGYAVAQQVLFLLNCIAALAINVGYVITTVIYNQTIVIFISLAVALLKLTWNEYVVPTALKLLHNSYYPNKSYIEINKNIRLQTRLIVINNIICPLIAISLISSNCFYNLFVPPPDVDTTLTPNVCRHQNGTSSCSSNPYASSYQPPYYYGYECSSDLVIKYAAIFINMFIFEGFGKPLIFLLLGYSHKWYMQYTAKSSTEEGGGTANSLCGMRLAIIEKVVPTLIKLNFDENNNNKAYFNKDRFIVAIVNGLAVMLTFGVIFPPLAIIIAVAMISNLTINRILIGRFIINAMKEPQGNVILKRLNMQCNGIDKCLWQQLWVILFTTAIIYGAFLIDISGNWIDGVAYSVVFLSLPVVVYGVSKTIAKMKCCVSTGSSGGSGGGGGGGGGWVLNSMIVKPAPIGGLYSKDYEVTQNPILS